MPDEKLIPNKSAVDSMRRITEFTKNISLQEYRDARDELFKFDDDLEVIVKDIADKVKALTDYRMRITSQCQLINSAFDETDRIFAGPRGQAAGTAMQNHVRNLKELRALLSDKSLRRYLRGILLDDEKKGGVCKDVCKAVDAK